MTTLSAAQWTLRHATVANPRWLTLETHCSPRATACIYPVLLGGRSLRWRHHQSSLRPTGRLRTDHVRISAIDAPESRQTFGQRSKQHLSDLCFEERATITPKGTDKYGRTVGDVKCQGKNVATEQVRAGMAWYYSKYGKGYEQLQDIEQAARQAGRGLWSMPAEPSWEWRKAR